MKTFSKATLVSFFAAFSFYWAVSSGVFAQSSADQPITEPKSNYILRDTFFLSPDLKIRFNTYEAEGFLLIKELRPDLNSEYGLVSGFENHVIETRALKDAKTIEDVSALLRRSVKTSYFMGVAIREVVFSAKGGTIVSQYWVGQRSFSSLEKAQASIVSAKAAVESSGGNFDRAIQVVSEYVPEEPKEETRGEVVARYKREEDFAIKAMDWLNIGEKIYGPFHTPHDVWGEPILWQSFGEGSFRFTNLEHDEYNALTGYWTNRLVLKGIRWIGETTLDPYIEVTPALESNGPDYKSNLQLVGGIEWYPFIRSAVLQNYRPFGIPALDFVRNFRIFAQWMERENLKDEILGSKDWDFRSGLDVFYEWGLDLKPLDTRPKRTNFSDYLHDFIWGEYYGTYHFEETNFSSYQNYDSWILNSSLILGLDWPSIPLPANPINNRLYIMPYAKFEHVSNPNHPLSYQNQYYFSAGVRLMPFRSYQFIENEWLFKTKLYVEYVGLGGVFRPSANTPVDTENHDVRFGVAFSHKRY